MFYICIPGRKGRRKWLQIRDLLNKEEGRVTFSLSVYSLLPLGGQQVMRSWKASDTGSNFQKKKNQTENLTIN